MPIRNRHIFDELPEGLNATVNPFVSALYEKRGELDQPLLFGKDLKKCPGHWRDVFESRGLGGSSAKKVILEIGMHLGQTLIELSQKNPDKIFLGVDITFKRVVSTSEKIKAKKLNNSISIYGDAQFISDLFAEGELDGAVMFFPDPWNKKKNQTHNRLIDEKFVRGLQKIIKPGGFFWLKTDDSDYFEQSAHYLKEFGFELGEDLNGVITDSSYQSKFEKRYQQQGVKTFSGVWKQTFPRTQIL